jgi:hypothetical protein
VNWRKWWVYYGIAAGQSLLTSQLLTGSLLDWRIAIIALISANVAGLLATKALESDPNK